MTKRRRRTTVALPGPYIPEPEANLQLGKRMTIPKGLDINEIVTVEVTGKVTALRADKYGKSLTMTIQRVKSDADETMGDSLNALRRARRY